MVDERITVTVAAQHFDKISSVVRQFWTTAASAGKKGEREKEIGALPDHANVVVVSFEHVLVPASHTLCLWVPLPVLSMLSV